MGGWAPEDGLWSEGEGWAWVEEGVVEVVLVRSVCRGHALEGSYGGGSSHPVIARMQAYHRDPCPWYTQCTKPVLDRGVCLILL